MSDISRREFFHAPGRQLLRLIGELADGRLGNLLGFAASDAGSAEEAGLELRKRGRKRWPSQKENGPCQ